MNAFTEMTGLSQADNAKAREYHETANRETALINQKNQLLGLIHNANEPEDLEKAAWLLAFVSELWEAVGYAYKTKELRMLLRHRAERLLSGEESYLSQLTRKNDKTRPSTIGNINRFKALIENHK